jgi:hypothetical protein
MNRTVMIKMEWYAPCFQYATECAFTSANDFLSANQISMAQGANRTSFCILIVSNNIEDTRENTHNEKIYFFF